MHAPGFGTPWIPSARDKCATRLPSYAPPDKELHCAAPIRHSSRADKPTTFCEVKICKSSRRLIGPGTGLTLFSRKDCEGNPRTALTGPSPQCIFLLLLSVLNYSVLPRFSIMSVRKF
jgi:hypothetical protein